MSSLKNVGADYVSTKTAERVLGGSGYTSGQFRYLADHMPPASIMDLARHKRCIIVPGPPRPVTLLDLRACWTDCFENRPEFWYCNESFAKHEYVPLEWIVLWKEGVADSGQKDVSRQLESLGEGMSVPLAVTVVYAVLLYFKARGKRLLDNRQLRTASFDRGISRISVGPFGKTLVISEQDSSTLRSYLGMAAVQRYS